MPSVYDDHMTHGAMAVHKNGQFVSGCHCSGSATLIQLITYSIGYIKLLALFFDLIILQVSFSVHSSWCSVTKFRKNMIFLKSYFHVASVCSKRFQNQKLHVIKHISNHERVNTNSI